MITYHPIDPVILNIAGPLAIRWYGLMYLIGFVLIWFLAKTRIKPSAIITSTNEFADLLFYAAIGVVLGGRLGYMLFYNFTNFISSPLSAFKIWEGGMSFHGGLIGVSLMMWYWAHKQHKPLCAVFDFIVPLVPIGLAAGRIGNFINGELCGKVTNVPWAIVYPYIDSQPRHPSQIYEFLLEGVALFLILWIYSRRPRPRMATSALFLIGYGCARILCEFFRQPDPSIGYLAFGWLTLGQILSLPMVIAGVVMWKIAQRNYE